jgi:lysophospholipase L1-like esterase
MLILILAAMLIIQPASKPATPPNPPAAKAAPTAATPAPRDDKGWLDHQAELNARAQEGHDKGDIGIVFLGDSITEQWLDAGKDVWDKTYAPRHAADFGISGDRTQHLLYRIQNGNLDGLAKPAAGTPPSLAVIMIGTNNTADDSAADIAAGITAVVNTVRAKLPDTQVLLLAVFPRGDPGDPARAKIKEINATIARLDDHDHIHYLDIGDKFLDTDGILQPDIMPDKLHLTTKGYQIWADAIEAKVKELLAKPVK